MRVQKYPPDLFGSAISERQTIFSIRTLFSLACLIGQTPRFNIFFTVLRRFHALRKLKMKLVRSSSFRSHVRLASTFAYARGVLLNIIIFSFTSLFFSSVSLSQERRKPTERTKEEKMPFWNEEEDDSLIVCKQRALSDEATLKGGEQMLLLLLPPFHLFLTSHKPTFWLHPSWTHSLTASSKLNDPCRSRDSG